MLNQNWSDEEANKFYSAAQGSRLLPYEWYLQLEQPDTEFRFNDARHVEELGYLPRSPDHAGNPDGLPVGFTKDGKHLGLTCAACHTSQIRYQGTAWLIDGGPTSGDFEKFLRRLVLALEKTVADPAKFERFANRVLGAGATPVAKADLLASVKKASASRASYNVRNLPTTNATPFGPGRVDAFGAILNEVAETFAQVPGNHAPADAPVSYPFLWDTPHHDRVQWNGAAENEDSALLKPLIGTAHLGALGRNAGEVLGVFGVLDASHEGLLIQFRGYSSSIQRSNLIDIEESLRKLWSPQWPAELPPIDESLRASGRELFKNNCISCHRDIDRTDGSRQVAAVMRAGGTDQTMASNFATRQSKTGILNGRRVELFGSSRFGTDAPTRELLVHMVRRAVVYPPPLFAGAHLALQPENFMAALDIPQEYPVFAEIAVGEQKLAGAFTQLRFDGKSIRQAASRKPLILKQAKRLFLQSTADAQDPNVFESVDGSRARFGAAGTIRESNAAAKTVATFTGNEASIAYAYKARPLNGIWATAPYLHNGSIPNLDELLKRPSQRSQSKFRLGSGEFDPQRVGFRIDVGGFEFDPALPGNSNAGHDYDREFTYTERKQLIEYLKSL